MGANLDLDQLKTQRAVTGRQNERSYFRTGPNAMPTCVQRGVVAIKAAGFAAIVLLPRNRYRQDIT
jgi:hypothetical protein